MSNSYRLPGTTPTIYRGQLPSRSFYEEQDEGAEGYVDLCLDLKAMSKSPAWKRIRRAAKFLDQSANEFVTHSIMEMVRTLEEDMILSPRTGEPVGDMRYLENRGDDSGSPDLGVGRL